jgi:DNA recombination protein RmuC
MQIIFIILIVIALGANIILAMAFFLKKEAKPADDGAAGEGLKLILNQVNDLRRTVDQKIGENTKEVSDALYKQFGASQQLIKEITSELAQVKEIGKQSLSVQEQLRGLEDILKNPKQRGILGEYYLETLLKNILPPGQYQMQYPFANGEIVDAAVFVKEKVIPIDSKFSLENYNRMAAEKDPLEKIRLEKSFVNDLKLRIQETAKYVRPTEKTMDFAFMFIPHEAIYYDLLVNKIGAGEEGENLIQRAASKYKVIIVSPTSFLAYLQTVLQGLKAMQIEETAKDIVKHVNQLGIHLKKYEDYHEKLGVSLGTVVNHYNNSGKEFKKIDKDVLRIAGEAPGIGADMLALEKPEVEN